MGDKISRLNSITTRGVNLVNTESLRDTLIDLHNYAAMAVMLLDEKPKNKAVERVKKSVVPNTTRPWVRDVGQPKNSTTSE